MLSSLFIVAGSFGVGGGGMVFNSPSSALSMLSRIMDSEHAQ